jgi:hypothetical protein
VWIALVIVERIPAITTPTEIEMKERHQGAAPPTMVPVKLATRTPSPSAVVVDPTSIVIRGPTPWFISNPGPAEWRTPRPVSVAIGCPIVIKVYDSLMWPPDPTVVFGVIPITVAVEIFSAPNIFIKVLNVIT